jgi:hypothetical protein
MLWDRFRIYLEGGQPGGSVRIYPGATDKSSPQAVAPIRLPFPLYFAMQSKSWGGGMAFVSGATTETPETLGRAYLITQRQLEDVIAQENKPGTPVRPIDLDAIRRDGQLILGQGSYDRLLWCGYRNGYPVVTFTAPWEMNTIPPGKLESLPPSAPYLRMLAAGLRESWAMNDSQAAEYLSRAASVAPMPNVDALKHLLSADGTSLR